MNKVIIKHSTVPGKIPTAADLAFGEIALNIADGRMYAKRPDGVVEPLAQSVDLKSFGTISADVGSMSATGPSQTFSVKGGSGIRITALSGTRELVVALNNADAATLGGRASSYFSPATHLHDDRYLKLQAQGGDYYTKAQVDGNISAAIDALIGGAGSAYDTLKELETALNSSDSAIASINATLATKLNASSYTAADVLEKLKTVDGASSGLDADLLDGQQASYYLSASNLNAGTVPVARLSGIYGIGISGNAATASKLAAPYSLSLAGHASGTVSMDGSANATLTVTVANDSHTHDARYYEKSLSDARYHTKSQSDARYTQPSQVQGAFLDRFGDYFASTGDNNTSNPGDTGLWATTRPGTPNFPGFAWIKTQRTYSNTAAYQFGINYENVASPGVPKVAYRLRGSSATAWGEWAEVLFSGHSGDGSGLTALNASNLATGTVNAARLPAATTSVQGAVQLNNTVTSTSITQAATANAAKIAHDAANDANFNANSRVSKSGDTMTNKLVINNANYQSHLQLVRGDLSVDISPSTVTGGELRFATTNIAKTVFDTSLEATSFMGGWAGLDYAAISTRLTLKNPSIPLSFEDTAQIGFIEHGDTYGLRIRTRVGTTGTGIAETFTVSNSGGVSWTGVASGNGSGLTSLNASNLASGTVPIARISSTSARNSSSETTLLHAKAMNDHIASGDHDSRYVNKAGDSMGGDLSISKNNPWLTLNSATSGANGVEQAAGLSIGESGYKGNAAMHLTYTGDGRGYIGMGTVDPLTSIPANAAMRMFYTSPNVEFLGTVSGNGSGLSALNASSLSSGTIPDARISGSYTGMANLTGSGSVDFARFLGNAADTVTAPSFSWTGDTNTGLYRPTTDTIGVAIAGVERARFSSAGISGVGTGLTSLNASNLTTGTVPIARISSTSVRNSASETTLLHAKAMNDHVLSGDHDSRYVNKAGDVITGKLMLAGDGHHLGQNASIALALGDADTGLKWVSDGVFEIHANAQAVANITRDAFSLNKPLNLLTNTSLEGTINGLKVTNGANGFLEIGNRNASFTHYGSSTGKHYFYGTVESQSGFIGSGAALTSLNANNLASGTIPDARISGSYTGMSNLTGSGNVDFARFLGNASDTVTAPSFSWTGDTNTGLYRPTADTIGVSVAGVERARFSSAGISGVGTGLTSLNASNLTTGTVPIARISSTSARNSTSEATLLHAKAMSDHVASGDHDGRYVNKTGDTITGALLIRPAGNAVIEHGRVDGVASTPFIDFHSSGNNIDYDSRVIANGGSTSSGNGSLTFNAKGGVSFDGMVTVPSLQITPGTGIALGTATPSTAYNINMNDTFSANGTRAAIYSVANIADGTLTGNRTHYGIYNSLRNDYLSTESYTLTQRAAFNEVVNGPANDEVATINTAEGSRNYVLNRANGTISSAIGCYNYVLTSRAGSTITNAYGSYNYVQHSLGTITNAYAGYFRVAGTITGHSFGLYVTGEDKNYFSGNVGIKTSSPTAELEVVGTVKATSFVGSVPSASLPSSVVNTDSKSNSGYLWIHRNSTSSALYITNQSTGRIAEFRSGSGDGAVQCYINNNGSIFSTDNITAYSDARLKTNIQPIKKALVKLEMLGGYTFDRTDKPGLRQTGVIAQEVLQVLPEAVVEQEDGKLAVAYGNMVGLLIEAIKELNAKVETLQEQLNAAA